MEYTNNRPSFSRFASIGEIKESLHRIAFNDMNPDRGGIPLYSDSEAVYVEKDDTHTLIIGSTGSKKTRLIGMPALQMFANAGESFIANDPKAELYKKTYPLLKKRGYRIFVLNLRDPTHSDAWNPLRIPYLLYQGNQKDKATELTMDMASCIAKNGNIREPYWENSAADLLAGLILLLFEYANENEIHFRSLRALRTQAFKIEDDKYPYIRNHFLRNLNKSSFLCALLSGTAEVTEETRSCIISEFDQSMTPFLCQDNLIDMLSESNFDMSEIGKTKTAVFLIVPDENTLYNKLISVFVKQCYTELLREAEKHPNNKLPLRVNFLLDEFSNLPAITDFPAMISASRSRNIRFNLFIQSQNQLVEQYGYHAGTIKGNCENWVFLHSRELSMLNEIAELSGMKNSEEPLISVPMLQTLKKEKGEAFILNKRLYPYITTLLDIDKYPDVVQEGHDIQYPVNTYKADAIFDFESFCHTMPIPDDAEPIFVSKIPNDEEMEEIKKKCDDFFSDDVKPIFTSKIPDDEKIKEICSRVSEIKEFDISKAAGVGSGWHGIIQPILNEINLYNKENPKDEIEIDQIKEKYGTLRFYTTGSPDYISGMISIAEKESENICEICGARGETVKINGWYSTLCPYHVKAKKAAGYDHNLASRLYRKFIDTYERSMWKGMYNPVIKRMMKKNWFVTKEKVNEIERTVRLERERYKTNFYIKTDKGFIKHDIYVQWFENTDKTLHDGYWHVMKLNEIECFGMLERESSEKEAAKEIFSHWGKNPSMELIRMVDFEEGQTFPQCVAQENFDDYWTFMKNYLVKNNIKMTGAEHQRYGIPLIECNGTVYAFTLSYSKWGKLMAEAFYPDNENESVNLKWANERPEGETSWVNPDM